VRRILDHDVSPEPAKPPGKPPQLLRWLPVPPGFGVVAQARLHCGRDIGCYTLGVLQPFEANGFLRLHGGEPGVEGLRHVFAARTSAARVSVIGDSTLCIAHQRPGGDDLQPAAGKDTCSSSGQFHHGDDGPPGHPEPGASSTHELRTNS